MRRHWGLSRWFNGFCASRLLMSSELQVTHKPLNPRRKVVGGAEFSLV